MNRGKRQDKRQLTNWNPKKKKKKKKEKKKRGGGNYTWKGVTVKYKRVHLQNRRNTSKATTTKKETNLT